jgi:hypothetical protein
VIAGFCLFGALDHQRQVLPQSSLPYLSEDRDSTSYQVGSVIKLPMRYTRVPLDLFCFHPIVHKNLIPTSAKRQNRGNLLFSMCIVGYLLVLPLWLIIFDPCSLLAATTVLIHF